MRNPAEVSRPRRANRGRITLIAVAVALFFVLTSMRGLASFYTTYLWFDELGFGDVWRGVLGTKLALVALFTAGFFVLLWVNLFVADRLAPRFRAMGPEDELVQRYHDAVAGHAGKVRVLVAALFALLVGGGTAGQWNNWLLFRNSVDFGTNDPQFGKDVSFYVFRLPFLSFLVDWLFVAVVVIAVVTLIAHYLNGGIRLQAPSQRVAPRVKGHISVLLGVLALLKAVGYYLQRYELNFSTRGAVQGATYTDVNAQLPALQLLMVISVVAFVLLLLNIRRQGWVLPIIAVGLWAFISVLVGAVYPAFIQKFRVEPSEVQREEPYIRRNIDATRAAMGLDKVQVKPFNYDEQLTAGDLEENASTIRNIRLWDPAYVTQTYQRLQEIRQYYRFNDVDVDRYTIDGELLQTIVSARELYSEDLPSQSWVNRHLQYTHGYGALVSPANAVTADGKPEFLVQDIPPVGTPEITEPRIYFGQGLDGFVLVNTKQKEIDFQEPGGATQESTYAGEGGVRVGSFLRKLAFALRFGDQNVLISDQVTSESRAVFFRDIRERVTQAAPFLRYDADPYPVIVGGRILWIQDAYTTTSRYPYAQQANVEELPVGSGLNTGFNYVRNSVKVVTDAYDGTMQFYIVDPDDPIAQAYAKAFPDLFTPFSDMSPELVAHLRYAEDIFRVQTNMYGRYHITDPVEFYRGTDSWNVSQDPGSGRPSAQPQEVRVLDASGRLVPRQTKRMDPTYQLLRLPGDQRESFLLLRPFVAASEADKQQNLTAFMTAKSDPGSYGVLEVFELPRGDQIDGPSLIDSRIKANAAITSEITLLDQRGSQALQGNILVLPINNSILYVRPLYVQSENNPLPELKRVIVVFADRAEMAPTLQEALIKVFGAAPETLEKAPVDAAPPAAGPTETTTTPTPSPGIQALIDQAQAAFDEAQAALRNGDLAGYQRKMNEVGALLRRIDEEPNQQSGSA
ncbi:MAG: UPF0182 family protein [Actinobacteria bacterium]|nr:UPF0182 family protein [Actinomycetota bacterium]